MDQSERQRLKTLANDAVIDLFGSGAECRELRLAQALESALESLESYDSMSDRVETLGEENEELEDTVKELQEAVRDIYRVTKSANSSDVKRLAEIQEICEEADVDLGKII